MNGTYTYNTPDKHSGGVTYGGYSDSIVVDESFVLRIPANFGPRRDGAASLCRHHDLFADASLGCHDRQKGRRRGPGWAGPYGREVRARIRRARFVFTTSPNKKEDALRLGADEVVVSSNATRCRSTRAAFDFILDCVAAEHDINAYIHLLTRDGNITLVGAPEKPLPVAAFGFIFGRRSLSGSPIGGIAETQEMLDFCGEHNITADVEAIPIQKINEAYERMIKCDVKYRFYRYGVAEEVAKHDRLAASVQSVYSIMSSYAAAVSIERHPAIPLR